MGNVVRTDLADRLRLVDSLLAVAGDNLSALQRLLAEVATEVAQLRGGPGPAARGDEVQALRREVEQLREGMASRAVIERAKGVLMQAHALTEQQAFDLLTELSHDLHRKVRDVAAEVLDGSLSPRPGGARPVSSGSHGVEAGRERPHPGVEAGRERPHLVHAPGPPPATERSVPDRAEAGSPRVGQAAVRTAPSTAP